MNIQLTVIGLDQVGVSFGLALEEQKSLILRCGHNPVSVKHNKTETKGAFDKIFYRMGEAVREADVILLSMPADLIEETLTEMVENLKPTAIVINTKSSISLFKKLAGEILPSTIRFISMIPAINGEYIQETNVPHWDLFRNAEMLIPTDDSTDHDAVSMVSELTSIVKAKIFFIDPSEANGIFAKTDLLPKLVSTALLSSTIDQPGWKDARRIAAAAYAKTTSVIHSIPEKFHPASTFIENKDNVMVVLDEMVTALMKIRKLVEEEDQDALDEMLFDLGDTHAEWMDLRVEGDWGKPKRELIKQSSSLGGRLFGESSKLFKK
jgi:prephenate dehydrogenase